MTDRRAPIPKKLFEPLELHVGNGVKQTEAEGLRQRRGNAVEHRICAGDIDPRGTAVREHTRAGLDEVHIALRLCAFQPPCQHDIGQDHRR